MVSSVAMEGVSGVSVVSVVLMGCPHGLQGLQVSFSILKTQDVLGVHGGCPGPEVGVLHGVRVGNPEASRMGLVLMAGGGVPEGP